MPMLDITEYFYQKLSYYIIFTQDDIEDTFDAISGYFTQPWFWKIFKNTLNYLCGKGALVREEVNKVYYFLSMLRYSDLGKDNWSFINDCIGELNKYPSNIQRPCDEFYVEETMKRFPKAKEVYLSGLKQSISLDFILLWAFISDDDEKFINDTVPAMDFEYPFIANIRTFYIEARDIFATKQFIERLAILLNYWEYQINNQDIGWIKKQQMKQKIKEYRRYI